MKKQHTRLLVPAIFLLLVSLGATLHFNQKHPGTGGDMKKSESVSIIRTKTLERPAPIPGKERLRKESVSAAAQKWYEELLEKYPRMKPAYRDVPDDQNGFLQFLLLAESIKEPKLPNDLADMLRGGSEWDAEKLKLWLTDNQDYLAKIMHVAGLPDQSGKGLEFDRIFQSNRVIGECCTILLGAMRLALQSGDQESALRYAKASSGLSDHLTDVEAPSVLAKVHASAFRIGVRDQFLEEVFPNLSDPQAMESWRQVIVREEHASTEYTRILSGEWNGMMRTQILPAFLGAHTEMRGAESFEVPDSDAFFDLYTAATEKFAASMSSAGPDRLEMSQTGIEFPESGTDPTTLKMLRDVAFSYSSIYKALSVQVTRTTMISAAISLRLGEQPPVDPVSGKPFQWDGTSRTLSAPEGVEGVDPINLH